jgi:hypothetical protein
MSQMFVDDTALFLVGNKNNLNKIKQTLDLFVVVFKAKLNIHKSIALWISTKERTWSWGKSKSFKWLRKGEVTNYLSFHFGWAISKEEKYNRLLNQIKRYIIDLGGRKLSLASRILIANQVVLATI